MVLPLVAACVATVPKEATENMVTAERTAAIAFFVFFILVTSFLFLFLSGKIKFALRMVIHMKSKGVARYFKQL